MIFFRKKKNFLITFEHLFQVRANVSLTTLLVLYTLFSQTSENLPRTSYIKMVDIWYMSVISLLFLIIVFHMIVEFIDRHKVKIIPFQPPKVSSKDSKFKAHFSNFFQPPDEKNEDPHATAEHLMKIARYCVVPAIFVVFNATFWFYWFF